MTNQKKHIVINNHSIDLKRVIRTDLANRSALGYHNICKMLRGQRTNPISLTILLSDLQKYYPNAVTKLTSKQVA